MSYLRKSHLMIAFAVAGALSTFLLFQNLARLQTPLLKDIDYLNGFVAQDPYNEIILLKDAQGQQLYGQLNGVQCPLYKMLSSGITYPLYYDDISHENETPWTLSQWDSQAGVLPGDITRREPGVSEWINPYKKVSIGKLGSGKKGVILGVNGEAEYSGNWATKNNICFETLHPALLVSQKPTNLPFARYKKLLFRFKSKIIKEELKSEYASGWDQKTTTAHLKIHVNIQNFRADKNTSLGHGQSFGLSINFFDVRNSDAIYAKSDFIHRPQKRYMLNLGPDDLLAGTRDRLHRYLWTDISNVDLMPLIREAFAKAITFGDKTDGYVAQIIERDLGKYSVSSINFGWEVSSLHNVEAHISDFNLIAER